MIYIDKYVPAETFLHENSLVVNMNGLPGCSLQSTSSMLSLFDVPT